MGCHPFLLIHAGTNDIAKGDLGCIKIDDKAQGTWVKSMGVQVMSSSILLVGEEAPLGMDTYRS